MRCMSVFLLLILISCCWGKKQIIIGAGTSFAGWEWRISTPNYKFNCGRFEELFDCVTSDRTEASVRSSDIILFHANEIERKGVRFLPEKQEHQLFISYSLESPFSFFPYYSQWNEYRNGKMDYIAMVTPHPRDEYPDWVPSTQKTIRLLFDHPHPTKFPIGAAKSPDFIEKKMRLLNDTNTPWISVMISYAIEWRVNLLRDTMAVFGGKIRSMGPVLNNYNLPFEQGRFSPDWNTEKQKVIQDYLFHFAWENSWVPGFITEKIFDCFVAGTVPIYVGTEDVYDLVPCDMSAHPCFIDYSHFQRNPVLLHNYIKYLVEHPEEYMKYFEWLNHPVSPKYKRMYEQYIEHDPFCRMCETHYVEKHLKLPM